MTAPDVSQRTALVTGAARGIGRATVEALAASGWRVVAGVRDPGALEPYEAPGVHVVPLDVTDAGAVRAGVASAGEIAGGALDCVVNNAGWALFGAIEDVDLEAARREFETNVFGALAVLQAALPAMREAGRGVVVSVSTLSGRIPLPLFGVYSATKLALGAVSEALDLELRPLGIRAVLIEAGVVRTDFARSTLISGCVGDDASPYREARDRVLGRLRAIRVEAGVPVQDVAAAIVRAVEDPASPFRVEVADAGLRELADVLPRPPGDAHDRVRAFFGLAGASGGDAARG